MLKVKRMDKAYECGGRINWPIPLFSQISSNVLYCDPYKVLVCLQI